MAITHDMWAQIIGGKNLGRARKNDSDMVMDAVFDEDIQYQIGYFFDYYHVSSENRLKIDDIDPAQDPNFTPIEVRFIPHSSKTYEKDDQTMHIQFRPYYKCTVNYYAEMFGDRYRAEFPVGLYVWLNENGNNYHRWLVVGTADSHENMFPTYEVLRCTDVYRWVKDGKLYEFPGVSRSQNSYNSGKYRLLCVVTHK